MPCVLCGRPNLFGQNSLRGRPRSFCSSQCRQSAYRRRRAGVPETALAYNAQAGRLSLAEQYERHLVGEGLGELEAARAELELARALAELGGAGWVVVNGEPLYCELVGPEWEHSS